MITDADRRKLHGALAEVLGPDSSELLMELLPPTGWANLATQKDVTVLRADIDIAKSPTSTTFAPNSSPTSTTFAPSSKMYARNSSPRSKMYALGYRA